ncbi:MAG: valine--tRNA ligase, partial [Okeania sp. SIO2D1]|nr:valine--tRNA ligase [Okeania sp. SIO2D1]
DKASTSGVGETDFAQIPSEVLSFFGKLPTNAVKWFTQYRQPIIVLSALLALIIIFRAISGTLHGLNKIPLVLPIFELIGLGYTIWFIFRFLLKSTTRRELQNVCQNMIEQVFGTIEWGNSTSVDNQLHSSNIGTQQADLSFQDTSKHLEFTVQEVFGLIISTIRTIRNLRAEADIKPGVKVPVILQSENTQECQILTAGSSYIQDLGKVEKLSIVSQLPLDSNKVITGVVGTVQVVIPLSGLVDLDALRVKLTKNLSKIEKELVSLSKRLDNPGFIKKAPIEVVQNTRNNLTELQKQSEILQERLQRLE